MRWSVILPISFLVLLLSCPCNSQKRCAPAFCGSVNVSYPFRLDSQPRRCGHHQLKEPLRCRNNRIVLSFPYANFVVLNITYNGDSLCGRIRMVDENLETDNCSVSEKKSVITPPSWLWRWISDKRMLLLNCTRDLKINSTASASIILVDAARCSSSSSHLYFAFRYRWLPEIASPGEANGDSNGLGGAGSITGSNIGHCSYFPSRDYKVESCKETKDFQGEA